MIKLKRLPNLNAISRNLVGAIDLYLFELDRLNDVDISDPERIKLRQQNRGEILDMLENYFESHD